MENLTSIEGISFAAATVLNLTFSNSYNLERITPLAWPSNYTGTLNGTFQNCYRLKDITPFQTSGVTNMALTFNGCRKLQDLSWADMSSVTVANGTLRNAYSIKKPPSSGPITGPASNPNVQADIALLLFSFEKISITNA